MTTQYDQDKIVVEPQTRAQACVIWLHGLGADGHDFEAIVPQLGVSKDRPVRFVFPHAPRRPVTINNGYVMRAWYDIIAIDRSSPEDEEGIRASVDMINRLIDEQVAQGIAASRIILAGFSQGGVIVLHAALRYPSALGGVMALSTYLPVAQTLQAERTAENLSIPLFMGHGTQDEVVQFSLGEDARDYLVASGYKVNWNSYAMPHSVCAEEIADIDQWLQGLL